MRGLILEDVGRIALRDDLADPSLLDARDVIVEVSAAGLCGSDLHPYLGREPARTGVVQGHEIVGRVLDAGPAVSTVNAGDRVVAAFTTSCGLCEPCRRGLTARCVSGWLFGYGAVDPQGTVLHGGQAERVRVPLADGTLLPLPDSIPDAVGVLLADNLPTAVYAVRRADFEPGATVGVVGLGSVGLLAVQEAMRAGAGSVVAVDPVGDRRDRATSLGVTALHPDQAEELAGSCDAVVEAAGAPPAQRLAFTLLRPGGTLSIIAVQTDQTFPFTPVEAYDSNLTIRAGRAPVRAILHDLLPAVAAGKHDVQADPIFTHVGVALEDGPELYRRFAAREDGLVKAYFAPQRR